MFRERFEELKHTGKLPSPSGLGMRLLMLAREDDCSIEDVSRAIQTDPALTGRILKLANSVENSPTAPVSTVKDAAVRLGLKSVCNVGLGFSLVSGNRSGRCRSFPYDEYWAWSLANSIAAKKISEATGMGNPAEIFTCTLLSRIGRLALASVHPEEYAEVLERLEREPLAVRARVEREHFAIDNREISAALMEDWRLPRYFCEVALSLDEHGPPDNVASEEAAIVLRILAGSSLIASVCSASEGEQHMGWTSARECCAELGFESDAFAELYDAVVAEWQGWGKLLEVPTPPGLDGVSLEERSSGLGDDAPGRVGAQERVRVLAVDDDPVSLRLLVAHLEGEGYEVATARNGEEALNVTVRWNPQMVITDWMMPEMDGLELCKHLRKTDAGRNLYILILTGRSAEEERIVEAFEAGADDYIAKPFSPKLLLARTRPGVRVIRLQEQNERHHKQQEYALAKLEVARRRLREMAMTDALTEIPNRRYAMKRLEKEWANSSRVRSAMSVIILDVDHFKAINDEYGHDVGDTVLWSTAQAIQKSLRRGDTCARIGGEEFLVICPNTGAEGAEQLADRIRASVEENHFQGPDFPSHVTVSLGVGYRTVGILSIDQLMKMADQAVYQAKGTGRNRVVTGYPSDRRRSA